MNEIGFKWEFLLFLLLLLQFLTYMIVFRWWMIVDCIGEWRELKFKLFLKTAIWLMLVSGIVCVVYWIHVLN